jgi:hypothetical protein
MIFIKPTILTYEDVKDIKFPSKKYDWTELRDFLFGVIISGIFGASVGFALLVLS